MIYICVHVWGKGNDSGRYIYCYFYCLRLVHPMAMGLLIYNFIQINKLYSQAMFTLYRIALRRHENHTELGFCPHIKTVVAASFLWGSKVAPHLCLKWRVKYRRGVHTIRDSFWAATNIISDWAFVHTQERLWRRDFCDWAKLRRANL